MDIPLRRAAYLIVEGGMERGLATKAFDGFIILLILTNVFAMVMETVPEFEAAHRGTLHVFDLFSVTVFTLEYLLRVWICVEDRQARFRHPVKGRLSYMATPMAMIDLGAVLPFFLGPFLPVDLRFLRVFRLLKLLRYSSALDILGAVIRSERRTLASALVVMLVLLVFTSSMAYILERDAQPERFGSIPDAMWWAVVTLTTVGFGDSVPVTPMGKLVGAVTTVLGFGMFALPAGILASAFTQEVKKRDFVISWTLVAKVPLFGTLKALQIADIVALLRPRLAVPGERIVRKDDPADAMFFIVEGEVEVDVPPVPRRLMAGDFFGEIALLEKSVRTATVTATQTTQLLLLKSNDFKKLLIDHPDLEEVLADVAKRRLAELAPKESS